MFYVLFGIESGARFIIQKFSKKWEELVDVDIKRGEEGPGVSNDWCITTSLFDLWIVNNPIFCLLVFRSSNVQLAWLSLLI